MGNDAQLGMFVFGCVGYGKCEVENFSNQDKHRGVAAPMFPQVCRSDLVRDKPAGLMFFF